MKSFLHQARFRAVSGAAENPRHHAGYPVAFLATLAGLLLLSSAGRSQRIEGEIKAFKHAFVDPASGRRTSLLSGLSATNISNEALLVIQPQLRLFSEDGTTNLTVASAQCVYNLQTKVVSSPEKLQAASADGRFSLEGEGFEYQVATGSLVISNQARAVLRNDLLGSGPQTPATARDQPGVQTNASPAAIPLVRIFSDHMRYQTNLAVFEGNVRVKDPQGTMTCGTIQVKFSEPSRPDERRSAEYILAKRSVVIDSGELRATGEQATYQQATDVVELTGNPRWRLRQYEGRAEQLVVNRGRREFHAMRNTEMSLPPDSIGRNGSLLADSLPATNAAPANAQPVQVRADDFEFKPEVADTNFNLAVFRGRVNVAGGKGNLSCELMTIKTSAPSNRTESVHLEQRVVMEQGDKRVTGDKAVYIAASDTVEFTGHPAWSIGQQEGTAEVLTFDMTNGAYRASRNVRMRLPPGSFGASAWLLADSGAPADAPALTSIAATNRPARSIEISTDDFEFRSAPPGAKTDTAIYRGHTLVNDPDRMRLSCGLLTAKLQSGTNQVETVVAEQSVDLEVHASRGERRAHGDKAVYTAGNGEIVLTRRGGVEIVFEDPKMECRGRGAKAVYAGAQDVLELTGDPVLTTPQGRLWGEAVVLDRANNSLKATGNWRMKLNPEALKKKTTMPAPEP